jgi:hypothetical protein
VALLPVMPHRSQYSCHGYSCLSFFDENLMARMLKAKIFLLFIFLPETDRRQENEWQEYQINMEMNAWPTH